MSREGDTIAKNSMVYYLFSLFVLFQMNGCHNGVAVVLMMCEGGNSDMFAQGHKAR